MCLAPIPSSNISSPCTPIDLGLERIDESGGLGLPFAALCGPHRLDNATLASADLLKLLHAIGHRPGVVDFEALDRAGA